MPDPEPQPELDVSCVLVTKSNELHTAAAAPGGKGHSQQLELVAAVSAEPAPVPIPGEPPEITAEPTAAGVAAARAERAERTRLCARHREILAASAITDDRISLWETISEARDLPRELRSWGEKVLPCMGTVWRTVSGALVPQIRLDTPIVRKDGRPVRYLFPKGGGGIIGTDAAFERDWANTHIPALLVEGTKQFQGAASTINSEAPFAIPFGLPGCWS
ncbi:hypothetical protein KBZ07_04050, partial [Cyanobium sp. BA20m-14]|uniref:hypothetical protein n=1 Tax=Cyanobium sp. BA20m-14 TaxID=2823703 RepID=UPI0020CEFF44